MANPLALVIEDEPDLLVIFSEALRLAGFDVEVARDGRAALTRLAELTPAVVTLDLNLPYVSGESILRFIHADTRLANTRVIITTAHGQTARALQAEADLVLVKPISLNQLIELASRLRSHITGEAD